MSMSARVDGKGSKPCIFRRGSQKKIEVELGTSGSPGVAIPACRAEELEPRTLLSAVSFLAPQSYAVGGYPDAVAVADLGNNEQDIVVANGSSNTVSVLLGNGDGTFQAQQTYPVGQDPSAVAVANLGTGHADIVVANQGSDTVSILLGNGDGTFQAASSVSVGNAPEAVAVADLGNGEQDLIVANYDSNTVGVLIGTGKGTFGTQTTFPAGSGPDSLAVADLGNGNPDVVVADRNANTVSVLLGNGKGSFAAPQTYATGKEPQSVTIGTFGNNKPDIAVCNDDDNTVGVFLGNGNGTFQAQTTYPTGNLPYAVAAGELANGQTDLVVANEADNTVGVLLGNGNGTFQAQETFPTGIGPSSVALAYLTSTGTQDIVVSNLSGDSASVLLAPSASTAATTTTLVSSQNPSAVGGTIDLTATVAGSAPTGTVSFYNGATELGSETLANGSATLATSALPLGNATLTADYSGDANNLASVSAPLTQDVGTSAQNIKATLTGTVPSSAVAGLALKLTERLTLTATSAAIGTARAKILLSPDGNPADSVLTLSSYAARLKLKAGQGKKAKLKLPKVLPAAIAAGTYQILVQLTDTTGLASTVSSGQSLIVAPAETDLTGSFVKIPASVASGKKASISFLITNTMAANIPAVGNLPLEIDETSDGQISDATVLQNLKKHISLKPGKSVKVTIALPIAKTTYLAIDLDPGDTVFKNDVNATNNSFLTPKAITVG